MLGTRDVLGEDDEIQPNGKMFKKLDLGEYRFDLFRVVYSVYLYFKFKIFIYVYLNIIYLMNSARNTLSFNFYFIKRGGGFMPFTCKWCSASSL